MMIDFWLILLLIIITVYYFHHKTLMKIERLQDENETRLQYIADMVSDLYDEVEKIRVNVEPSETIDEWYDRRQREDKND